VTNLSTGRPYYSKEFKQKVLTSILHGEMSAYAAQNHYQISGSTTVYRWLAKKESILGPNFVPSTDGMKKNTQQDQEEAIASLKAELAASDRLLQIERMKSAGYLKMIRLAEEKFSIPIEKKFGAK
jgi:transposase